MTDEKNTQEEIKEDIKKPAKNHLLFFILLSLFVLLLFVLSINFSSTYQLKESPVINDHQEEYIEDAHNKIKAKHEEEANYNAPTVAHKKETSSLSPKTDLKKDNSCGSLLNLMRDYYNMKLKIDQGKDFTNELEKLVKYKINSQSINENLENLSGLIKFNMNEDYFRTKFHSLIRDIYLVKQKHKYDILFFLKGMLFIRPVGIRAVENGGMDMEVALVEKALLARDLSKAYEHLINISNDNSKSLQTFKDELENKLRIKNDLKHLDEINKLDCDEVSN